MPKEAYYKKLFYYGAIWNWAVGGIFSIAYKLLLPLFGMEPPVYPVFMLMFMGCVILFGIAHFWISRDLYANIPLVKLLIVGKPFVLIYIVPAVMSGQIPKIMLFPAIVDFILGVLFVEFMITYNRAIGDKQLT